MQLLICDPWGYEGGALAQLSALIAQRNWQIVTGASPVRLDVARDYPEWLLLHERQSGSRSWRKLASRAFNVFIGFGGASALFAAFFPTTRKIAIVEQLETSAFAQKGKCESPVDVRRFDLQLPYHRRVEMDLLQTFDRVLCRGDLAQILRQYGWSDDCKLIPVDGNWQEAIKRGIAYESQHQPAE